MAFYFTPANSYPTEPRKITAFYAKNLHMAELSFQITHFDSYLKVDDTYKSPFLYCKLKI